VFGQVNWAGPMPGSRPAWYLTHEYAGRDQACDLQKLQVAPLAVPLFLEGQTDLSIMGRDRGTYDVMAPGGVPCSSGLSIMGRDRGTYDVMAPGGV